MVISITACLLMSFLICYGNMWFLFFYLCSFWSLRPCCQVELGTHPLIHAAQVITLCHDWLEEGCGELTRESVSTVLLHFRTRLKGTNFPAGHKIKRMVTACITIHDTLSRKLPTGKSIQAWRQFVCCAAHPQGGQKSEAGGLGRFIPVVMNNCLQKELNVFRFQHRSPC